MDVGRWLLLHLAVLAGDPVETIDPDAALATHDLDSFDAIHMTFEIAKVFGIDVDPEIFLSREITVAELTRFLRSTLSAARID